MDLGQTFSSPMTLIGLVGGSVFLLIWLKFGNGNSTTGERKIQQTRAFVFLREQAFFEAASDSFDGLVSYGFGGFVEITKTSMFLYFGRPFSIFQKKTLSAKKRVGVYLCSIGNPMPMNPYVDSLVPDAFDKTRYYGMKDVALAREVDRGKNEASGKELPEILMAVTAVVIGVVCALSWLVVIALPLTGFVEKS
jgi:hypothetical protein